MLGPGIYALVVSEYLLKIFCNLFFCMIEIYFKFSVLLLQEVPSGIHLETLLLQFLV